MSTGKTRVAVMISGRGSNMSALIEAAKDNDFPAEIVLVVSNKPAAAGLDIARSHGIEAVAVDQKLFSSREAHEEKVAEAIEASGARIVCLAGYMRLLTPRFVARFAGRMINIHPSLLPLFPGLDTHRRALEAGMRLHGCTVHFVTEEMDGGPIIAQAAIPVRPGDTIANLENRLLAAEHRLYPHALRLVASGRARMEGARAIVDMEEADGAGLLMSPAAS
ncbi:phosphoribosylglycinamide formyltransferase [Aureimonas populi]|uniref:Phosphoribosylglycinamide formyltransferase n=1 Tax=Aureimonas populi TaxID=1701758 RepID=A0ABW5CHQ4_9HYPH|nr:phosphoribosylglycinamide formyltransferase [Aureimonas populi]